MRKALLYSFILVIFAAGVAFAQQQPPVYPVAYWVNGTLQKDAGDVNCPEPVGYKAVVYKDSGMPSTAYAVATADATGKFQINPLDDRRFGEPVPNVDYFIGVVGKDGYGVNETAIQFNDQGYINVALTLKADEGIEDPEVETGLIINTRIYWTEDGIIWLEWDYAEAVQSPQVDIWRLKGDVDANLEFSTGVQWELYEQARGGTQYHEPESELEVGDGKNAYYRIVPAGTALADIFQPEMNNKTVGKVDVLLRLEYNAVASPFKAADYSLQAVIGNQLDEGDQIHYWSFDDQAYRILTKTHQWPDYTFKIIEGFFVYLAGQNRQERLSLVGEVGGFAPTFFWPLGKEYNLLGYPYPKSGLADTIGFDPREGDQIHRWNWDGQSFTLTTFVDNAWKDEEITRFSLSEGKFYYIPIESIGYDWTPEF